ncbi:hypothetical protein pb186bvf_008410 [Paramecium bursaria]
MYEKQAQTLIYSILLLVIVLLITLFSTNTVYQYQQKEEQRFFFSSANYWGRILSYTYTETDCDSSKPICLSINSCRYQAIWSVSIAAIIFFIQCCKNSFLMDQFKNNPKGAHAVVLFLQLLGVFNSFSIPIYRYIQVEEEDQLLLTPILIEFQIGSLFIAAFVLEFYLMLVKSGARNVLHYQVLDG